MDERRRAVFSVILLATLITSATIADDPLNPDEIDAAGCLIATPSGFVMGINRLLNRLQLPAGRHLPGETARQTAARETREETGLDVAVGDRALALRERRVVFYFCTPTAEGPIDYLALTPTDRVEISRVVVVNPVTMTTPDGETVETPWRFPQMHWLLRSIFAPPSPAAAVRP